MLDHVGFPITDYKRSKAFYEKLGFSTIGEEFELPPIGPHYLMEIRLMKISA